MTCSYYNEIDPSKAAWLRELMKAGAISPGEVDERPVESVRGELGRYGRCHFFAGIGVWDYALDLAGWDIDGVWTGSCPCPSFSAAGKGEGFDDARHLWPHWFALIREHRPRIVLGEQVAAAVGFGWLDLISADLEAEGYAVAAAVLGAHSVGAPHIRQRLFFCAVAPNGDRRRGERGTQEGTGTDREWGRGPAGGGAIGDDADAGREHGDRRPDERGPATDHAPLGNQEGVHGQRRSGAVVSSHAQRGGGRTHQPGAGAQGGVADGRDRATGDGGDPMRQSCQRGTGEFSEAQGESGRARLATGNMFERSADAGEAGDREYAATDRRQPEQDGSRGGRARDESRGAGKQSSAGSISGGGGDSASRGLGMHGGAPGSGGHAACADQAGDSPHAEPGGRGRRGRQEGGTASQCGEAPVRERRGPGWLDPLTARSVAAAGATRGWWRDCDWWYGRDGKFRPIGSGINPLVRATQSRLSAMADGPSGGVGLLRDGCLPEPETAQARVMRLRGYGDAIVAPVAATFVAAVLEALQEMGYDDDRS